jgi:hypothetical protein
VTQHNWLTLRVAGELPDRDSAIEVWEGGHLIGHLHGVTKCKVIQQAGDIAIMKLTLVVQSTETRSLKAPDFAPKLDFQK